MAADAPAVSAPLPSWLAGLIGALVGIAVSAAVCCWAAAAGRCNPLLLRLRCCTRCFTTPDHSRRSATAVVFDALTHAVLAVRPDGTILEANSAVLKLFGYTSPVWDWDWDSGWPPNACGSWWCAQDELIGRPIGVLLPPDVVEVHHGRFRDFGTSGDFPHSVKGQMLSVRLRCADSSLIPCQLSIEKAVVAGENVVVASLVDLRPVRILEQVRAACMRVRR